MNKGGVKPRKAYSSRKIPKEVRRRLDFDRIGNALGIQKFEDWYKVKAVDLKKHTTKSFLERLHRNSLSNALMSVYPEFDWNPSLFQYAPKSKRGKRELGRRMLDSIAQDYGIERQEDWYLITLSELHEIEGQKGFLRSYNYNLFAALFDLYPEYDWNPLLFSNIPTDYWRQMRNKKRMLQSIRSEFRIQTESQWNSWITSKAEGVSTPLADELQQPVSSIAFITSSPPEESISKKTKLTSREWDEQRKEKLKKHAWEKRRKALDWIGEQLGVKSQEDWYFVTPKQVESVGGLKLLASNSSLHKCLCDLYPEFIWDPSRFARVPRNHWKDLDVHRKTMDRMAAALGVETHADWYTVTSAEIKSLGGASFLQYYKGSLPDALMALYPEFEWNPVLFAFPSMKMLKAEHATQRTRKLWTWVGEQLGVQTFEDWYKVLKKEVKSHSGRSLFNRSTPKGVSTALVAAFPEFEWNPFLFQSVPRFTWRKPKNQREMFDWLATQLNIETQEGWYEVTGKQVKESGANALLSNCFNNSLYKALKTVYPMFDWNPMLFVQGPHNYINNIPSALLKDTVNDMLEKLNAGDIHRFPPTEKLMNAINRKFGCLKNFLRVYIPDRTWPLQWTPATLVSEQESTLGEMLKSVTVVDRQKNIAGFSLDYYLPEWKVAIEVQGEQHYTQTYRGSVDIQRTRDIEKREKMRELGITLVEIPYWWRGNLGAVLAKLQQKKLSTMQQNLLPAPNP